MSTLVPMGSTHSGSRGDVFKSVPRGGTPNQPIEHVCLVFSLVPLALIHSLVSLVFKGGILVEHTVCSSARIGPLGIMALEGVNSVWADVGSARGKIFVLVVGLVS